jgi:broad specificity phosphatase PhoE
MKLWFETHATSIDNERGVASGHRDAPLSELGRRQALELGARYEDRKPSRIYTSDLTRAVSTASIAFAGTEIPQLSDPRLRECDYGTWSGCSVQQMNEARVRFVDHAFPGGESFRDVVRRIESFLNGLSGCEGPVLVISHRAPWYALEHLVHKKDLAEVVTAPWQWRPGWEYEL